MSEAGRGLDRDLVCIDLETTGGNASFHRIIEIGCIQIDRDGSERTWSTLVNPGIRIPSQIEVFTGITNAMVEDAPPFSEVYRELLERLDGRVFVAHNARFDYGFVRAELARLDIRFSAQVLCTVKLSRRLYPEARRHNLDTVMERHGLNCSARHRALGDALVLRDLLQVWRREHDAVALHDAVEDLLHDVALPPQLAPGLSDDLPEFPGVYRFYGEHDGLLYVGKSLNIRKRVLEHFAAEHRSASEARLARQVRRVDWTETAGELGALLQEARSVKELQPVHNRRLRAPETYSLRFVQSAKGVERLEAVELNGCLEPGQEYFGLYKDAAAARRAAQEVARAHQLCTKALGLEAGRGADDAGSCFAYQLGRCKGACVGAEPVGLHHARARIALSAQRLKSWPFRGRVVVVERDWRGEEDLIVLAGWCYLGTVREEESARELSAAKGRFDADVYRILKRFLADPGQRRIVELD